jgi:hypothetical protein
MLNLQVIKNLSNGLVNDVIDGLRLVIKGGYRGKEVGAHVGGHGHQPEMPFMKRGLPDHEDQFSLLF